MSHHKFVQMRDNDARPSRPRTIACLVAVEVLLAGCGARSSSVSTPALQPDKAYCVLKSPMLQVGTTSALTIDGTTYTQTHQPDAASPIEQPISSAGSMTGSCSRNTTFKLGSGLYEITGPLGGNPTGHADLFGMSTPTQIPIGLHTRLYSRAFAMASPCNGKRVMFVSNDLLATSALERQEILKAIAADQVLSQFYSADNVMISATHTHSAAGGYGTALPALPLLPASSGASSTFPANIQEVISGAEGSVFSNDSYDSDNFQAIVTGTVQAIRRAHKNLEQNPDGGSIKLSVDELLNANVNRTPPAFQQNSPTEQKQVTDANGNIVNVDKRFVQLTMVRNNGAVPGIVNWFGVHPTSMGNHVLLISSDNKGYAALGFEKLMKTQYAPDAGMQPSGADNFVASFAQTDEGDSIPDLFIFDKDIHGGDGPGQGVPYRYRGGSSDPYDFTDTGYRMGEQTATAISGTKQLAQALRQFGKGKNLSGPIDYRYFLVDFSADEVTDPVILQSQPKADLPQSLYAGPKTTCTSAVGVAEIAGGVNGPGPGAAGYACAAVAPSPYLDDVRNKYNGLFNGVGYLAVQQNNTLVAKVPFDGPTLTSLLASATCVAYQAQPQYGCQAEKPIYNAAETNPVPFQIFRVGNLAIVGLPWEITTMAGRRIRKVVLDALSPVGVDTVVIAGLSNDYLHYMTTREEYTAQMYEASNTIAGPWQLAAVEQESRKLALAMASNLPSPASTAKVTYALGSSSPITVDAQATFGAVITDALPSYSRGDKVDVSFVAGYPGNDLKTMAAYFYVERQNTSGSWDVVETDGRPALTSVWNATTTVLNTVTNRVNSSSMEAIWTIPMDAVAGTYRIRHTGVYRLTATSTPVPYSGLSSTFSIAGSPADCP